MIIYYHSVVHVIVKYLFAQTLEVFEKQTNKQINKHTNKQTKMFKDLSMLLLPLLSLLSRVHHTWSLTSEQYRDHSGIENSGIAENPMTLLCSWTNYILHFFMFIASKNNKTGNRINQNRCDYCDIQIILRHYY